MQIHILVVVFRSDAEGTAYAGHSYDEALTKYIGLMAEDDEEQADYFYTTLKDLKDGDDMIDDAGDMWYGHTVEDI